MQPDIKRFPLEFYGEIYTGDRDLIKDRAERDYCPFREDGRCIKTRKSSDRTIGTCIVGYPKRNPEPHCICPHRLETDDVLEGLESALEGDGKLFILSEVTLKRKRGRNKSIDYIVGLQGDDGTIQDFIGVEGQAIDTSSGSVWGHREAFFDDNDTMEEDDDSYSMNWAMSLTKTMMQQALNKAPAFENWDKKLMFLIQDVSLEELRDRSEPSHLRPADDSDPIHFRSYTADFDDASNQFKWVHDETVSTDLDAVVEIMGSDDYPSRDEFEDFLLERLN